MASPRLISILTPYLMAAKLWTGKNFADWIFLIAWTRGLLRAPERHYSMAPLSGKDNSDKALKELAILPVCRTISARRERFLRVKDGSRGSEITGRFLLRNREDLIA
jgi:hypothetical protein